jgi:hypothetical protein
VSRAWRAPGSSPAEDAAILGAEELLGEGRVGQQLPATLVVKIADQRGDHAVLAEEQTDGVERPAELGFEGDEVAGLVVAIGDVDAYLAVEDLFASHRELARIGMDDGEAMALGKVAAERGLLVGPVMEVFRLDETKIAAGAADGLPMIDQQLDEQIALVTRQLDLPVGVVGEQGGHDIAHYQLLGQRREMDAPR